MCSQIKDICLLTFLLALPFFHVSSAAGSEDEIIKLGKWTEPGLETLMTESASAGGIGERIGFISAEFLGTPYVADTLTGSVNTPEVFTIDLEGMDCFTYVDYVEALSLSDSFPDFEENLRKIRYKDGVVAFRNRNHFFSDWPINNSGKVKDMTREIGGGKTRSASKSLNLKKDGTVYLPGIPVKNRTIYYIPSSEIDGEVTSSLRTGDYAGIFTEIDGLDVSHTGIIVKKGNTAYLRHASSRKSNMKVVDENLTEYMQNKPGLVVYRPVRQGAN
ncbi:MAG TPA: DUF1460 domain-containing protein [Thermodesulfobacteriota bacterium]|nr:DUF1460 domain-containing protein [Thermodesulfobacteriota bacterium]